MTETTIHVEIQWHAGRAVSVKTDSPDLDHFLHLVQLTRSLHTWVGYAFDLREFFRVIRKPPDGVTRHDCIRFVEQQRARGLAATTINRRLAALSSFFAELTVLDPQRFPANPISPRPQRSRQGRRGLFLRSPRRLPLVLEDRQIEALLTALPGWRDRALALLLLSSCLRVGEAVALDLEDVNCDRRSLSVRAGKGALARTTYMTAPAFGILNRYLDLERGFRFQDQAALFVVLKGRRAGQRLSVNAVQKLFRRAGSRAGIPGLHPHILRHSGITRLIEAGLPEPVARTLVGHRRPESLRPYLHLSDHHLAAAFEAASGAFAFLPEA